MTEPDPPTAARARRWPVAVAMAAVTVALDQAAKLWAESALPGRAPISVLGDFLQLRLVYNPGAAFSMGRDLTWALTLLGAAAVVGIGWYLRRVRSAGWAVALGLLLGGAFTHLLDRLFREPGFAVGHVVDFIDYNDWFVGNVADIALTFGAGLVFLLSLRGIGVDGSRQQERDQGQEAGAEGERADQQHAERDGDPERPGSAGSPPSSLSKAP